MIARDLVSQATARGYAATRGASVVLRSDGYSVRTRAGEEFCVSAEDAEATVARALRAEALSTYALVQRDLETEAEAERQVQWGELPGGEL